MEQNKEKLKFFGMLATNPNLDLISAVQKLGISLKVLKTWKVEYSKIKSIDDLDKVVSMESLVAEEVIDTASTTIMKQMIEALPEPEPLEIDEVAGEVVKSSELEKRNSDREAAKALKQAISDKYKAKVTSLKELQQATLQTAVNVIELINERIITISTNDQLILDKNDRLINSGSKDLVELTSAISSIQNAFFNRNGITINPDKGNELLENFRNNLKP